MKHSTGPSAPVADRRRLAPAALLLAGAVVYGVLVGGGSLRFTTTPLLLGVIVVAAGLVGTRRRVIGTGLVLAGWGAAVVLVDHGVVPGDRTTPAYMLGIGAGLLVALAAAPRRERADWLTSASITAFTAPLSLYLRRTCQPRPLEDLVGGARRLGRLGSLLGLAPPSARPPSHRQRRVGGRRWLAITS